jgi:hypothetical protein
VGAVLDRGHDLAVSRAVGTVLVRDDHSRDRARLLQQPTEEARAIVIPEGAECVKRGISDGCRWFRAALIGSPSVGW